MCRLIDNGNNSKLVVAKLNSVLLLIHMFSSEERSQVKKGEIMRLVNPKKDVKTDSFTTTYDILGLMHPKSKIQKI